MHYYLYQDYKKADNHKLFSKQNNQNQGQEKPISFVTRP